MLFKSEERVTLWLNENRDETSTWSHWINSAIIEVKESLIKEQICKLTLDFIGYQDGEQALLLSKPEELVIL